MRWRGREDPERWISEIYPGKDVTRPATTPYSSCRDHLKEAEPTHPVGPKTDWGPTEETSYEAKSLVQSPSEMTLHPTDVFTPQQPRGDETGTPPATLARPATFPWLRKPSKLQNPVSFQGKQLPGKEPDAASRSWLECPARRREPGPCPSTVKPQPKKEPTPAGRPDFWESELLPDEEWVTLGHDLGKNQNRILNW